MIDTDPLDKKYRTGWRKYYVKALSIKNLILLKLENVICKMIGKPNKTQQFIEYMNKVQQLENKKHRNIKIGAHRGLTYCPICIRGKLW